MKNAQENIRTSNAQQHKVLSELSEFKSAINAREQENETLRSKIGKLMAENNSLGEEVRNAQ